ncbi:hypothetical protein V2J09_009323 [Rumex salicifolius]
MESSPKCRVKFAVVAGCVAAVSLCFAVQQWRLTSRRRRKSSCYLENETKPQYSFKRVLVDNSYSSFNHLICDGSNSGELSHPYEKEIKTLVENPQIDCSLFHEHAKTEMGISYKWVENESQLQELVDVLLKEKIIAVDTEQHSLRSFRGFTALIQISTATEDYLVDTIALHDFISMLRPVFADSCICKVFHGADNDVLWLQRDFHIYVVNLFDTAKACEVLSKPQKSLAYLLETYCGVATNKLLQLEDWRQRPMSEEMVLYARIDAHYLLHIAGCLIDELMEKKKASQGDTFHFLYEASRRSNSTCLQLYMREDEDFPGESAALSILSRQLPDPANKSVDGARDLVRKLCAWRDLMARIHDESVRFVLSDHAVVSLANKIPMKEAEVLDTICHTEQNADPSSPVPSLSPSPVILSHWEDLLLLTSSNSDEDILLNILKMHLGADGTCPLSIQNYALLSKFNIKLTSRTTLKQNGFRHAKHDGKKSSRELFVRKFSCKSPVYHNCRIYASDGLDENPPAIMLLFEPKGRPEDEDNDFYIQSKKNMCVGCGEKNHYLRYRIIPSCYRMYFPEHLKSHRSHDIVLLCVDCHEVAHAAAEKYKRNIAEEFGIPLFVGKVADPGQSQATSESNNFSALNEGVSPLQLRTAAMALLRHGQRMPIKRRDELMEIVRKYYGGREISQEDLEKAFLVGMSPYEQRKFEKKRGLSCKQAAASITLDNEHSTTRLASFESLNSNGQERENRIFLPQTDESTTHKENGLSIQDEDMCETGDTLENFIDQSGLKDTLELPCPNSDGSASTGLGSKVSLLGHGPHGKKVVEYLLGKHGDDGINQFCQRWRQVFVDTLNPKHLPGGWDIMHSGRRDFGEFSVYNPAKRLTPVEFSGVHEIHP